LSSCAGRLPDRFELGDRHDDSKFATTIRDRSRVDSPWSTRLLDHSKQAAKRHRRKLICENLDQWRVFTFAGGEQGFAVETVSNRFALFALAQVEACHSLVPNDVEVRGA